MGTSRLAGFYDLPLAARRRRVADASALAEASLLALGGETGLTPEQADHMIENVIGVFGLPLGSPLNFLVNGREVLVPMAIEEPSVVAGASFMAKLARDGGGFQAETTAAADDRPAPGAGRARSGRGPPALLDAPGGASWPRSIASTRSSPGWAAARATWRSRILPRDGRRPDADRASDLRHARRHGRQRRQHRRRAAGAARRSAHRRPRSPAHPDATWPTAAWRAARCRIPAATLAFGDFSGERVRDGIVEAWAFAEVDPYRAATHNKGIMNGVDAVVIATGNDWRAIEAGAHAYAARSGRYTSLSRWSVGADGGLEGRARDADGGGDRGRRHARPPGGPGRARADGRALGARAGGDHRLGRPGPEPGRAAGPGDRGHPARAHGAARPPGGDRRRRRAARWSSASPSQLVEEGARPLDRAQEILRQMAGAAAEPSIGVEGIE